MKNERILYGVKRGDPDWKETILSSVPEWFDRVKELAGKEGWGRFREAEIDLSKPPNFAATLNLTKGQP